MINKAAKTFRKSIRKSGATFFKNYFDLDLPIKEASKGFALASSFLDFVFSSAPSLGALAAFFIPCAVFKAKFL